MNRKTIKNFELKIKWKKRRNWEKVKLDDPMALSAMLYMIPEVLDNLSYKEVMVAMFLDCKNVFLGYTIVSIGTIGETPCDTQHILRVALLTNAERIVIAHTHPHGECDPSEGDINTTKEVVQAAALMHLEVIDHIILTENTAFFFSITGLMKQIYDELGLAMTFIDPNEPEIDFAKIREGDIEVEDLLLE